MDCKRALSEKYKLSQNKIVRDGWTVWGHNNRRLGKQQYNCWCPRDLIVRFKMISVHLARPICASPHLSEVSATLPLKQFHCLSDSQWSFHARSLSASSFYTSLLQEVDEVVALALCLQVVSQVPQHFRDSETQAACDSCFSHWPVCSVISLHSGMSRARHPQVLLNTDVEHWLGCPIPLFILFVGTSLNLWGYGMCGPTVTSWGSPAEGTGDRFHLHCQAGG